MVTSTRPEPEPSPVAALSRIRALETSAPPLLDSVAVSAEDLAWNPRRNSSSTELADAVSPVHLLEPTPHRRSQWIPHPRRGGARLEPRPQQAPSQDPASGAGRSSLTPASARPGLPIEASHCPRSGRRRQRLLWPGLCLRLRPREPTREGRQGGERGAGGGPAARGSGLRPLRPLPPLPAPAQHVPQPVSCTGARGAAGVAGPTLRRHLPDLRVERERGERKGGVKWSSIGGKGVEERLIF
jgi:hypothetical protein